MAWVGALCQVLAAYGSADGKCGNKAGLAHWLGRGRKVHAAAWVQAMLGNHPMTLYSSHP